MENMNSGFVQLSVEQLEEVSGGRWVEVKTTTTGGGCTSDGKTARCASERTITEYVWID
jgi:hypothetical protein